MAITPPDMVSRLIERGEVGAADEIIRLRAIADKHATENHSLRAYIYELEEWKKDGERRFADGKVGVLFSLGAWWAERPWRARK